jgi:hypothetical protein
MEAEEARLLQPLSLLPSLPPLFEKIPADHVFVNIIQKQMVQEKVKPKPHILHKSVLDE